MGDLETRVKRIERTASWSDDRFEIPGLGIRFGWDAIVGLIPGVGDLLMTLVSFHILVEAILAGVPRPILLRMGSNMLIESVLGSVPLFGDVFDVFWKANRKNASLFKAYLNTPQIATRNSRWFIFFFFCGMALLLGLVISLAVYLTSRVLMWISS